MTPAGGLEKAAALLFRRIAENRPGKAIYSVLIYNLHNKERCMLLQ
jgi:hypothetical protein